jgi:hypothetical protein
MLLASGEISTAQEESLLLKRGCDTCIAGDLLKLQRVPGAE